MLDDSLRTPLHELIYGIRDQLPLLLGVVPLGLIFGALALSSGVPPLAAQGLSLFLFAGSAQFVAISLMAQFTPPLAIVMTVLVVNLRHVLYSANFASHLRHLPSRWKMTLSWLLTDEAFAVASLRYSQGKIRHAHWYTLGTGMGLWASWQISTALGIALGSRIPRPGSLDFALPLTLLALLSPQLVDQPSWAAALSAGICAVLLAGLPFKLNLLIGAILGILVGMALESLQVSRKTKERKTDE